MVNWQAIGHQLARQVKLNYKKVRKKREQEREKERERERERKPKSTLLFRTICGEWHHEEKRKLAYVTFAFFLQSFNLLWQHPICIVVLLHSGHKTCCYRYIILHILIWYPRNHFANGNVRFYASTFQLSPNWMLMGRFQMSYDKEMNWNALKWRRLENRLDTIFFSHVWNCYEVLLAAMIILMKWEFDHVINIYSRNKQICTFIYLLF